MAESSQALAAAAVVQTSRSARYLGQLCKHFQHKLPVTFEGRRGRIEFAGGVCELDAPEGSEALHLRVTAREPGELASLEDVVTRHLVRFAFREPLAVEWTAVGTGRGV